MYGYRLITIFSSLSILELGQISGFSNLDPPICEFQILKIKFYLRTCQDFWNVHRYSYRWICVRDIFQNLMSVQITLCKQWLQQQYEWWKIRFLSHTSTQEHADSLRTPNFCPYVAKYPDVRSKAMVRSSKILWPEEYVIPTMLNCEDKFICINSLMT